MRKKVQNTIDPPLHGSSGETDTISSVLALLEPRAEFSAALEASDPWSFRFPPEEGVRFCTVIQGRCWFKLDEVDGEVTRLEQGDSLLLFSPNAFVLSSDLSRSPEDVRSLLGESRPEKTVHVRSSDRSPEAVLLGGRFVFNREQAFVWLSSTEPFVHIPASSKQASVIGWMALQLRDELSAPAAGSCLVVAQLAQLLLVQALRAYFAAGKQMKQGWLGALADPKIGATMNQIHCNPQHRWNLKELASGVGMSQSAFSALFKRRVGIAPLDYVLRWRMQLAIQALRAGKQSLAEIALSLGYGSESAFGNAFKRVHGSAPRRYKHHLGDKAGAYGLRLLDACLEPDHFAGHNEKRL